MPKITSVEPQKRNPKRFNIFLDGSFAFGAHEDLIVEYRLVIGKDLSASDMERLIQEAEVGKLMERMYRFFNIRQRSEKEIRDYLKDFSFKRKLKGDEISDIAIDSTINKLKIKGLINDKEFATSWVESRSKKYGPRRIKQELFNKGIDKEIIEEVIRPFEGPQSSIGREEDIAEKLLERKINSWKNLEPLKFKKKAFEFLMRRGFEYNLVKTVVENFLQKR